MNPEDIAVFCARFLAEKIAQDIVILDLRGKIDYADYFVICTGINERQIRTMVGDLEREIKDRRIPRLGVEGRTDAKWVLFDLGDVIVHIFSAEARRFYDLEMLWGDAPRLAWEGSGG